MSTPLNPAARAAHPEEPWSVQCASLNAKNRAAVNTNGTPWRASSCSFRLPLSSSSSSGNSSFSASSPSQGHSMMERLGSRFDTSTTVNRVAEQCLFSETHPSVASAGRNEYVEPAHLLTSNEVFNSHLNIALCIGHVERERGKQLDALLIANGSRVW